MRTLRKMVDVEVVTFHSLKRTGGRWFESIRGQHHLHERGVYTSHAYRRRETNGEMRVSPD